MRGQEMLGIQEIIDHCNRKMERERTHTIFYREHEAVRAYLEELLQHRKTLSTAGPCDFCRHNPPSSLGGKPCSICPAAPIVRKED